MSLRRVILAVVLWCFGVATTLLLVGLWGRSVTQDRQTVAAAVGSLSGPVLSSHVASWLAGAPEGVSPGPLAGAVGDVLGSPEGRQAVQGLVGDLLRAAEAPAGSEVVVEVGARLAPLAGPVAERLEGMGAPVRGEELRSALAGIAPIVVAGGAETPVVGGVVEARRVLRRAAVAGAATVLILGGAAVRLAEDRRAMFRHLAHRVSLSALGFVVFLRLGRWALDPSRGGADVSGGCGRRAPPCWGAACTFP